MSCCDRFVMTESQDEFKMWQGLVGAHYTPYVDNDGNLSWTNNGGLANPATVNIKGQPGTGLEIKGIVDEVEDLPSGANSGDVYLVGEEPPYDGYLFVDGGWTYIGVVGVGENGRGIASITKTGTSGLVDTYTITYTDNIDPTTFTVTNGADGQDGAPGTPGVGVPTGGTTGQVLAKRSGTNYDTEWVNQSGGGGADPATATPLMDGTAAVGTAIKYAREDHVHPTDTSRASASDLSTLSGGFKAFTITLASASWSSNAQTVSDVKFIASGYSYIVSPSSSNFTDYAEAQIYADDVTTNGSMTFHCSSVPLSNLTVNVARVVAS